MKKRVWFNSPDKLEPLTQELSAFIEYEEYKHYKDVTGVDDEDDLYPEYDTRIMQLIEDCAFYKKLLYSIFRAYLPNQELSIPTRGAKHE